ncbi:hypothetical protein [Calorimonas adulescens]|uniref:Uncharacterized protein n=1 Tax=Calorimonas adulescens TaxID=2606906 RepID=A0A5D8QC18_9THEO|nr:hypothetical protein [Calorimonas adulescens]TZE80868.1 hypothetical protein FWJ32_11750 [Calorimonas adulescens]
MKRLSSALLLVIALFFTFELTHLIVDDIAKGNYPVCFTEGVALLEEYRINGFMWGDSLDGDDHPYKVEELTSSFNYLDAEKAYRRSFEIVKGISDEKGFTAVLDVIKYLGEGKSFPSAIDAIELEINYLDSF